MKLHALSINQLSELTGKDRRTIKKYLEALAPAKTDNRADYYNSRDALALLYAPDMTQGLDRKLQIEELRNQEHRNEKLKLEIDEMKGRLVPIEDVAKAVEKEYTFVRSKFRSIPTKLAKPISMILDPNEARIRLQEAVDECLTELTADTKYEQERLQFESAGSATEEESSDPNTTASVESGSVGGSVSVSEPGIE